MKNNTDLKILEVEQKGQNKGKRASRNQGRKEGTEFRRKNEATNGRKDKQKYCNEKNNNRVHRTVNNQAEVDKKAQMRKQY